MKKYCWLNIHGFKKLVIMPDFSPMIQQMIPADADIMLYSKQNINTALNDYEIWTFRLVSIASEHMAYYELYSKTKPTV